jgi:hydrogenase expression/formation protein HypE
MMDGAVLELPTGKVVMSTDSFVITPIFFPGGDIGKLSVCGTVNDLVACGARPLFLSAAFIIEEGFPLLDLEKIARSMLLPPKKQGQAGNRGYQSSGKRSCGWYIINTTESVLLIVV